MDFAFFPSPMTDFGYDVSDYRGVDPSFGTLVDFRRLLTEAFTKHFYYRKFVDSEQMVSLVMEEPSSK